MFMIIRHKVADFAEWKRIFDEHAGEREAFGSKGGILFQDSADPNEAFVLLEWSDPARAREFIAAKGKQTMEPALLHAHADVYYLNEVERFDDSQNQSKDQSRVES